MLEGGLFERLLLLPFIDSICETELSRHFVVMLLKEFNYGFDFIIIIDHEFKEIEGRLQFVIQTRPLKLKCP